MLLHSGHSRLTTAVLNLPLPGSMWATASEDSTIKLWNASDERWQCVSTLFDAPDIVRCLSAVPAADGTALLFAAGGKEYIHCYQLSSSSHPHMYDNRSLLYVLKYLFLSACCGLLSPLSIGTLGLYPSAEWPHPTASDSCFVRFGVSTVPTEGKQSSQASSTETDMVSRVCDVGPVF